MSDYVKLDYDEMVELHGVASDFVAKYLRPANNNNPTMHLASYVECRSSRTHFICPIQGVNSLNLTLADHQALEDMIPGAEIYTERMPDASEIRYELNIPILRKRSSNNNNNGTRRQQGASDGNPTLEWPLLLAVVETGLCGLFYYRWTAGLVF